MYPDKTPEQALAERMQPYDGVFKTVSGEFCNLALRKVYKACTGTVHLWSDGTLHCSKAWDWARAGATNDLATLGPLPQLIGASTSPSADALRASFLSLALNGYDATAAGVGIGDKKADPFAPSPTMSDEELKEYVSPPEPVKSVVTPPAIRAKAADPYTPVLK